MENWSEYVGYLASVFVVVSFLLKDITALRTVNLLGCICFVIYGVFSGMLWPIIIPNAILSVIQVFHIIKKD
ncbi:uroporphyrinogen decarboxylase [Chryseobacterium sp. SC28]|uniref:uroporphyrinogen decarboxylase n=1 Tax=Chryseobacterium sp. SC28 TaxID=2268028 RepID=UPI000F652186|nr:uroporphyrinogen decarboxylase [Chryseobacterium sp. SC28]RRQ47003.1 uroporphyrinogen decarboxylase [Chryseobacterium sp. SC28]